MIVDSKDVVIGKEKPMRITRMVSVILNGVILEKLAAQNSNDVHAIADSIMMNLSDTVQNNILHHELTHVNHSLRVEIGRRINLPQAI